MFERWKERRAEAAQRREAEAAARAAAEVEQAQQRVEFLETLVDAAKTFEGIGLDDPEISVPITLKRGERMLCTVTGAALGEPRSGGGHWEGGSRGVSVHIPGTKSMRYRVGATKGQYLRNEDVLTAIDTGTFTVTNQRAVFAGAKQTREWAWSKLVGVTHAPDAAVTSIAVSNRQRTSSVAYDPDTQEWVRFWIDLATARFGGTDDAFIRHLEEEVREARAHAADTDVGPSLPSEDRGMD